MPFSKRATIPIVTKLFPLLFINRNLSHACWKRRGRKEEKVFHHVKKSKIVRGYFCATLQRCRFQIDNLIQLARDESAAEALEFRFQ